VAPHNLRSRQRVAVGLAQAAGHRQHENMIGLLGQLPKDFHILGDSGRFQDRRRRPFRQDTPEEIFGIQIDAFPEGLLPKADGRRDNRNLMLADKQRIEKLRRAVRDNANLSQEPPPLAAIGIQGPAIRAASHRARCAPGSGR